MTEGAFITSLSPASRRLFVGAAVAVAWLCGIGQALLPRGSLELDAALFFANGVLAAIYLPVLFAVRGGRLNVLLALVGGVLGVSHFAWIVPATLLLSPLANVFDPALADVVANASAFGATGLVFGAIILVGRFSWPNIVGVALMTAASTVLIVQAVPPWLLRLRLHDIGLAAAPLHLGLSFLAAADAWVAIRREERRRVRACVKCGYSRAGLPVNAPCPECGRADHPAIPES